VPRARLLLARRPAGRCRPSRLLWLAGGLGLGYGTPLIGPFRGPRGDVKPSKELSPLPRLDEPFPVMGCDYLSSFENLNSPREMKLLKKITLYSGSLGSGVDEERS
jgi:hypothetical protein